MTKRKSFLMIIAMVFAFAFLFAGGMIYTNSTNVVYAAEDEHSHSGWTAWTSTNSLPSSAGNYYLANDITIDIQPVRDPSIISYSGGEPYIGIGWSVPNGTTRLCLNGKTVTINPGQLNNNYGIGGPYFSYHTSIKIDSGAKLELYDEDGSGRISTELYIYIDGGSLTLNDGTLNSVRSDNGGSFTMNGGTISAVETDFGDPNNTVDDANCGVRVVRGSYFTMNGGTIRNCANIGVDSKSNNVVINGGLIESNKIGLKGSATINGGTISNNNQGVYVYSDATLTIEGGEIKDNSGDGVYNAGGTVVMNDGIIYNNGRYGVYNFKPYSGGKSFTMNGGKIYSNAESGVCSEAEFVMTGGIVETNAKYGVYATNGSVKLSGTPFIRNNSALGDLAISSAVGTIELVDALDGGSVGITLLDENGERKHGVFTNSTEVDSKDYLSSFYSNGDHAYFINISGNELMVDRRPHRHYGEDYYAWDSKNSLPTTAGNYYLWNDVTLTESWTIPDNTAIKLCLNGHTISGEGFDDSIVVVGGIYARLEITDEHNQGTITTTNENCESVIKVIGGTVIVNNAIIAGNAKCGIKLVEQSAAFIHDGCAISGLSEHGIRVDNSLLSVDGGSISNNGKYGVYANLPSHVKLSGGTISENLEGGVYTNRSINVSHNPVIIDNGEANARNVVLGNADARIIVESSLEEGANIGITMLGSSGSEVYGEIFSYDDENVDYFSCDNPLYRVVAESGYLKIAKFNDILVSNMQNGDITVANEAQVGKTVTISINADVGYQLESIIVVGEGTNVELSTFNPREQYSFTMPDCDVTISATFESKGTIVYQKWDVASEKFVSAELSGEYLVLSNGSTITNNEIGTGATNPSEWVVVDGDNVDMGEGILKVVGDVNLILKDGCYIQVRGAFSVSAGNSLTIYAGSQGTGRLFARNQTGGYSAIGGQTGASCGTITIHGGIIEAQGADTGIGGSGAGNGGNVTIYGGSIEASGLNAGIGAGGEGTSHGTLTIPEGYVIFGGNGSTSRDILEDPSTTRYKYMQIKKVVTIEVVADDKNINYLGDAPASYSYVSKIDNEAITDGDLIDAISNKIALACDYTQNDDAGEYAIEVSITDDGVFFNAYIGKTPYKVAAARNGILTVDKIACNISVSPTPVGNLVYTGEEKTLVNSGETNDGEFWFKINNGEYSNAIPTATNAGTYVVYYKVVGNQNHIDSNEESIEIVISKANLTYVDVSQNGTLTYNISKQTPVIKANATSAGEQEIVFTYSTEQAGIYSTTIPAFTDAGTYVVYYKVNAANHNEVKGSFEVVVEKANPIMTRVPTAKIELTYKNLSQELIVSGLTDTGTILYKLEDGEYDVAIPSATLVGQYEVFYKVIGNQNYNDVEETIIIVSISENDKTELNDVIDSATEYSNSISGEYAEIATMLNAEIEKANLVKNNENVTEDKIESAYIRLYLKFNDVKIEVLDAKVNVIIAKIDAIGLVENTAECKAKIDDARNEYNTLAVNQKSKVTNYQTLLIAESTYAGLQETPIETPTVSTNAVGIAAIVLSSVAMVGMIGYAIFYFASRKKKLSK